MTNIDASYVNDITSAIASMQVIEFALKTYISGVHDAIRLSLNGRIPYKFSGDDIKNAPLERLLVIFSKLNDNVELQSRLNQLKEGRNHVAHQAFLLQFKEMQDLLGQEVNGHRERVSAIRKEANSCVIAVGDELKRMGRQIELGSA